MAEEYPTLGGEAQSWANVTAFCTPYDGTEIALGDLKDLSWGRTVEVGEQRSTGGRLKATTIGQPTYTAKLTHYASGYDAFLDALAAIAVTKGFVDATGAARVSLVHFDIVVHHTPLDQSFIREKKILGCRMLSDTSTSSEGTDAETVETELKPSLILVKTASGVWTTLL